MRVIDDDKPGIVIRESAGGTAVLEGGTNDSYTVRLTRAPAAGETVTVSEAIDAETIKRILSAHLGLEGADQVLSEMRAIGTGEETDHED